MITQVLFLTLIALASSIPTNYHNNYQHDDNIDYMYRFKIMDDNTYNYQSKSEKKVGKLIKGLYSLVEPTGDLRVVKYVADDSGFHAYVKTEFGKKMPDELNYDIDKENLLQVFLDELSNSRQNANYGNVNY